MLAPLQSERQLLAIEVAMVAAALKLPPQDAKSVMRRLTSATRPPDEQKPAGGMASQMLDAFRSAGFKVEHTTKKPSKS